MVRWIAGIILAFLLIDHIWVHYGGPLAERLRGQYREELKRGTIEKEEVPLQQSYRKSILDQAWERVKGALKREKAEQKS
ncbi:MAG: hypothetical protein ACK42C_09070 [Aquificaceae bacterium]|jgi:hypothetical protein|uniref:hypothetical protein n=1 Tax=Hydrogenobacter sp. Uz 6-8 TaxID=3384828 RepID=UPI0030A48580